MNLVYISDSGEYYKDEYKYCSACGNKLEKVQEIGDTFDRITGERIPGDVVIKCDLGYVKGAKSIAIWPYWVQHDKYIETDLDSLPF